MILSQVLNILSILFITAGSFVLLTRLRSGFLWLTTIGALLWVGSWICPLLHYYLVSREDFVDSWLFQLSKWTWPIGFLSFLGGLALLSLRLNTRRDDE